MKERIDKGCSILNATDEAANPYGLVLSEVERNMIYGQLNRVNNMADSLRSARTGWRPQLKAAFTTTVEIAGVGIAIALIATSSISFRTGSFLFFSALAFLILWKLNVLLTHETVDEIFARREREDSKEAKERAQYFKDMGTKDMSANE